MNIADTLPIAHRRAVGRTSRVIAGLPASDAFALWLLLTPAMFDYRFKNPTAISLAFYAALALVCVIGCILLVMRHGLQRRGHMNSAARIGFMFLGMSIGSGLLRGQSFMDVVRAAPPLVFLPFVLLGLSALSASGADARAVWRQTLIAAVVGMMFQLTFAVLVRGVDLNTVRYEVLTGAAPLLSAFAVSALLSGTAGVGALSVIGLHAAIVLISVTRTQLVVAAVVLASLVLGTRGRVLSLRRLMPALVGLAILVSVILAVGLLLPGAPLERWATRFFETQNGQQITAITRAGEARYQIQQMGYSLSGLIFGFGIAAPTAYDPETARLINYIMGRDLGYWGETGFGHNNYVGTFYVGGLIAGGTITWLQLVGLIRSFTVLGRLSSPQVSIRFRGLIAVPLAYIGYETYGALAGTFSQRSYTLLMAVSMGLVFWIYEETKPSAAKSTSPPLKGTGRTTNFERPR